MLFREYQNGQYNLISGSSFPTDQLITFSSNNSRTIPAPKGHLSIQDLRISSRDALKDTFPNLKRIPDQLLNVVMCFVDEDNELLTGELVHGKRYQIKLNRDILNDEASLTWLETKLGLYPHTPDLLRSNADFVESALLSFGGAWIFLVTT